MAVNETEMARLQVELTTVEASIKNITESGQSFRKGGFSGFAVEQVKLPSLYAERSALRAKLSLWELY